jgi:phosphoribosylformylglycinamidine cyclo-ligase
LIGGETAEMPGMYPPGEYDLAGFAVGAVEKSKIIDGSRICPGDAVIAIASSGAHSNGYSLVRKIIEHAGAKPSDDLDGRPLIDVVMAPTEIYVKPLLKLMSEIDIKGLAHITGGGIVDNVPRVLPEKMQAVLQRDTWQLPALFRWLQTQGSVADAEMVRVFNCGIGMILIVTPELAATALQSLVTKGLQAWVVGEVRERPSGEPQALVI